MRRKPLIGITGYHVMGEEGYGGSLRGLPGQGFSVVGHDYIQAVMKAGGIPVGIHVGDPDSCQELISSLDGLVLSGGEDIDPSLYHSHPDMRFGIINPERDRYEMKLLEAALEQKLPVLAICRGMQLVNVYFGGTLYKDIQDFSDNVLSHQFCKGPRWYPAHKVKLTHSSLIDLYQEETIMTNTYHHQAVRNLAEGLLVTARSEDGIVEGISHPEHPQLLAIQWHPEMMAVKLEAGLKPFQWLMKQVKRR